jgi:uncharacterized phage-like protein YoqJ
LSEAKQSAGYVQIFSGMASGVDLWALEIANELKIKYVACIPFTDQEKLLNKEDRDLREKLIRNANKVVFERNRYMVDKCAAAVVVWGRNTKGRYLACGKDVEANI